MLTAKVITPAQVSLYAERCVSNYRLVEKVKFDVARAAELFRVDVAALVSEVVRQEQYIEVRMDLIRGWNPRGNPEKMERIIDHIEGIRDAVTVLRRRINSEFEGRFF